MGRELNEALEVGNRRARPPAFLLAHWGSPRMYLLLPNCYGPRNLLCGSGYLDSRVSARTGLLLRGGEADQVLRSPAITLAQVPCELGTTAASEKPQGPSLWQLWILFFFVTFIQIFFSAFCVPACFTNLEN